jgi:hypothetical protein
MTFAEVALLGCLCLIYVKEVSIFFWLILDGWMCSTDVVRDLIGKIGIRLNEALRSAPDSNVVTVYLEPRSQVPVFAM